MNTKIILPLFTFIWSFSFSAPVYAGDSACIEDRYLCSTEYIQQQKIIGYSILGVLSALIIGLVFFLKKKKVSNKAILEGFVIAILFLLVICLYFYPKIYFYNWAINLRLE